MDGHRGISAVIFDMDGLLLDTERVARRAWDRAMADWGLAIPETVYQTLIGRRLQDVREILVQAFGRDCALEQVVQRKQEYLEAEIARDGVPLKAGALDLIDWLDSQGIPKAVGSSGVREVVTRKLALAGVASRFETVICGDEISRGKPAPDIFLAAARQLQVPPIECAVLEDSEPGIRAALAAGMTALLVPDVFQPSEEVAHMADRVFLSLLEVKAYLEERIGV